MIASILIDNIGKAPLKPEWGLAIFIDYNGHKLLLDSGASKKFAHNAAEMGIELEQVEFGVLSHAHYDHANGMDEFFKRNKDALFYLREGSKENCYGKKWIFRRYAGIRKGTLEKYKDRIAFAKGNFELIPGVTLIPHYTEGLEKIGKEAGLYVKDNGKLYADAFAHEQSLVFDTEKGLVIFNSCSHGGADNIINEISTLYPDKKIYALIGGFHLFATRDQKVRELAGRIKETGIEKIYTGHCTGERALKILQDELGERVEQIYTGMRISI